MPRPLAVSRTGPRADPSIEPTTITAGDLLIIVWIWEFCCSTLLSANWSSTTYPRSSSRDLRFSPSRLQRSRFFVGIDTPMSAPSPPFAPL